MKYKDYIKEDHEGIEFLNLPLKTERQQMEFQAAIKEQDASAQCYLAYNFYLRKDYGAAANYFLLSAKQSFAPAEYFLGICFFYGYGAEKDEDNCKYWMWNAAMDGCASAALFMGVHYDEDQPTEDAFYEQDNEIASFWYYLGAKMGSSCSMNNLAYNLWNRDYISAKYWYNKAAQLGMQNAVKWRQNNPGEILTIAQMKKYEDYVFNHKIVEFGKYYINNKDKKDPIQWIVCGETDKYLVLITKEALFSMRYYNEKRHGYDAVEWANSDIRHYLNSDFIKEAFSVSERARLIPRKITNQLNPVFLSSCCESSVSDLVSIPDLLDVVVRLNKDEWKCTGPCQAGRRVPLFGRRQWPSLHSDSGR